MAKTDMDVEDLEVYQKLCQLHIEVCDKRTWNDLFLKKIVNGNPTTVH